MDCAARWGSIMRPVFVIGMLSGYAFVDYAFLSVWIDYITANWEKQNLPKAAYIVNFQDGIVIIASMIVAHVADDHLNRFKVLFFTCLSFIAGIMLLWIRSPDMKNPEFYSYFYVFITFGQAGISATLTAFFIDQFKPLGRAPSEEEETRAECCGGFWSAVAWAIGVIVAAVNHMGTRSWSQTFMISFILMLGTYFVFLLGFGIPSYVHNQPTGRPSKLLEKSRRLIKLLPVWALFLVYSIIDATGNTFFIQQSADLDQTILGSLNLRVSVNTFPALKSLIRYVTSTIADFVIRRYFKIEDGNTPSVMEAQKRRRHAAMSVRMGIGFVAGAGSCFSAWKLEQKRLNALNDVPNMSILWLAPQFGILGLSNGLIEEGLKTLFYNNVPKSMRYFHLSFNGLVLGIGRFFSVLLILACRQWFSETIDGSRLDKYYFMLAMLCSGTLIVYFVLSFCKFDWLRVQEDNDGRDGREVEIMPENAGRDM